MKKNRRSILSSTGAAFAGGIGISSATASQSTGYDGISSVPRWATSQITSLSQSNEISTNGRHAPDEPITRAQLAEAIVDVVGESTVRQLNNNPSLGDFFSIFGWGNETAEYTDISDHPAQEQIKLVADAGFIDGKTDSTFEPEAPATRAELFSSMTAHPALSNMDNSMFESLREFVTGHIAENPPESLSIDTLEDVMFAIASKCHRNDQILFHTQEPNLKLNDTATHAQALNALYQVQDPSTTIEWPRDELYRGAPVSVAEGTIPHQHPRMMSSLLTDVDVQTGETRLLDRQTNGATDWLYVLNEQGGGGWIRPDAITVTEQLSWERVVTWFADRIEGAEQFLSQLQFDEVPHREGKQGLVRLTLTLYVVAYIFLVSSYYLPKVI